MPGGGNKKIQFLKTFIEQAARDKGPKWEMFKEQSFFHSWRTPQFHGAEKMNTPQIGGQKQGGGPDVLKFIKKFDPQNASGSVKKSLDIMTKLRAAANTGQLEQAIQPLENILGSSLFGAMQAAGAKAAASEQAADDDIIRELIAAAMEKISDEDAILATDVLDATEIQLISEAYYQNKTYVSAQSEMPVSFVNAINQLIPVFRMREGL